MQNELSEIESSNYYALCFGDGAMLFECYSSIFFVTFHVILQSYGHSDDGDPKQPIKSDSISFVQLRRSGLVSSVSLHDIYLDLKPRRIFSDTFKLRMNLLSKPVQKHVLIHICMIVTFLFRLFSTEN